MKRHRRPWKYDPANPDMVVCARQRMNDGTVRPVELSAAEANRRAKYMMEQGAGQGWRHDPLYDAAAKLRRRRKARGQI